jgi:hypothetical protein
MGIQLVTHRTQLITAHQAPPAVMFFVRALCRGQLAQGVEALQFLDTAQRRLWHWHRCTLEKDESRNSEQGAKLRLYARAREHRRNGPRNNEDHNISVV